MDFGQDSPTPSPLGPVNPKLLVAMQQTHANEAISEDWSLVNFVLGGAAAFGVWYFWLRGKKS